MMRRVFMTKNSNKLCKTKQKSVNLA